MNRIGERMREYRRSIKMTQADFASRLGVTGAAVSAYETGNRLPSYEVLVKIANILGVSPTPSWAVRAQTGWWWTSPPSPPGS